MLDLKETSMQVLFGKRTLNSSSISCCHFEFFTAWENQEGSGSWTTTLRDNSFLGLEIPDLDMVCFECKARVDEEVDG